MATFAVVTDGADRDTVPALRAAGADVVGLLGPDPFDSLAWAAAEGVRHCYPDLGDLLRDATEAVCIDDAGPSAVHVTRAVLRAGRHVLLRHPVGVDPELLETADEAMLITAVALRARAWPATSAVLQELPLLDDVRQLTVLGWPADDRLELVDVVRQWCGDIVAVCASPQAMPAGALAGRPVTLALLTTEGTTVLISEDARAATDLADVFITVIGTAGRLVVNGRRLLRQGGSNNSPATPLPDIVLPAGRHPLEAAAAGLMRALRDDLEAVSGPSSGVLGASAGTGSVVTASLRDVLVAGQVLTAAEASLASGGWEEL